MKFKKMFCNRLYYYLRSNKISELKTGEIKLILITCEKSISLIEIFSLMTSISSIYIASKTAASSNRINIILNSLSITANEKKLEMNGFLNQMHDMASKVDINFHKTVHESLWIAVSVGAFFFVHSIINNHLKFKLKEELINRGEKI